MRILFLLFSFTVGGTEHLVADTCNTLVMKGHDVHLYIVNDLISEEMLKCLSDEVKVKLQNRKVSGDQRIKSLFKINKYIKTNRIQVVHCNSLNAPDLLWIAKLFNPHLRIVQTFHSLKNYDDFSGAKKMARNIICDQFIAISDSVKKDVIARGVDENKIITVLNGINTDKFQTDHKKEFDANKVILGCVARLDPEIKGQDVLIKAISIVKREYPEIKCCFAGGPVKGRENILEELKLNVIDLQLQDNVEFRGSVTDVPTFLNEIDLFVLPSRLEGFGLSLVEAMSMGVPVISSRTAGPEEIVNTVQCGMLYENNDPADLAEKIMSVLDNYSFYKQDVWEKRLEVSKQYSITKMVERLEEVYEG